MRKLSNTRRGGGHYLSTPLKRAVWPNQNKLMIRGVNLRKENLLQIKQMIGLYIKVRQQASCQHLNEIIDFSYVGFPSSADCLLYGLCTL